MFSWFCIPSLRASFHSAFFMIAVEINVSALQHVLSQWLVVSKDIFAVEY